MKTPLEVNQEQAQFDGQRVRYLNSGWLVPLPKRIGAVVTICAWHKGQKELTAKIKLAGYETTHGICEPCLAKQMAKQMAKLKK